MYLQVLPKSLINLCSSTGRNKTGIKCHYKFLKGQSARCNFIKELLFSDYYFAVVFVSSVTLHYGYNKLIFKLRFPKLVQNQQGVDSSAKPNILSHTLKNSKHSSFFPDSNYFSHPLPIFFHDLYDLYSMYIIHSRRRENSPWKQSWYKLKCWSYIL